MSERKIIYACESGEYSDYRVEELFSTREDAELYAKAHDCVVVERTLDPDISEYRKGLRPYRVIMQRDGTARDVCVSRPDTDENNQHGQPGTKWFRDEWLFYVWAEDEQRAVKVSNERRAQHLALGTWDKHTSQSQKD